MAKEVLKLFHLPSPVTGLEHLHFGQPELLQHLCKLLHVAGTIPILGRSKSELFTSQGYKLSSRP